jgi:hypothetical protein
MKLDPHCFANSIGEPEDEDNLDEDHDENDDEDLENESPDVWMPIYATAMCGQPKPTKTKKKPTKWESKTKKKPTKKGEPFLALHTYT